MPKNGDYMHHIELYKIVLSIESFKRLNKLKLPAVLSFKLSKLSLQIEKECQEYQKISNEKMKEYGTQTTEEEIQKNIFHLEGENLTKFNEEIQELNKQKVNLDFDKIKIDDKFPEIEPEILLVLNWLFE